MTLKELLAAVQAMVMEDELGKVIADDTLAALTIWCEARNQPFNGKLAVGEVIRNRMKQGNKTVPEVVFAPYQFSCWNTQDPNRLAAMKLTKNNPYYQECLKAWHQSASTNLTKYANHYVNLKIASPIWAVPKFLTARIGDHSFYKL